MGDIQCFFSFFGDKVAGLIITSHNYKCFTGKEAEAFGVQSPAASETVRSTYVYSPWRDVMHAQQYNTSVILTAVLGKIVMHTCILGVKLLLDADIMSLAELADSVRGQPYCPPHWLESATFSFCLRTLECLGWLTVREWWEEEASEKYLTGFRLVFMQLEVSRKSASILRKERGGGRTEWWFWNSRLKNAYNWLLDSFIKLHQVEPQIPLLSCQCTIACLVFYTAVSQQQSLPVKITPVCMCQTLVIVSCTQCRLIVSPLFINTTAPECFSQALPGSACSEALLLISTSTYTERSGFSWVDSALCFGFETKSLDVLQLLLMQFLSLMFPLSRITITFGVHW